MKSFCNKNSFTLVEVLVVIVIIVALAALTVGAAKHAWVGSARSRTQSEIAALELALDSFKNDNGFYPPSTSDRNAASTNACYLYAALAGGSKQYFTFRPDQLRSNGAPLTVTYPCGTLVNTSTVVNVTIVDAFGNPFNYYRDVCGGAQSNQATFDLWSYGQDGKNDEGTNDDITNWRR